MRALLLVVAALLLAAPAVQARSGGGTTGVQLVEQRALTFPGARVAVADGRVYVATEGRTGSTHFPHASTFEVLGGGKVNLVGANPRDLVAQGGYGYVATGPREGASPEGSLVVVDARDPAAPNRLGEAVLPVSAGQIVSWATGVAVQGGHAYIAYAGGVEVVDVSNPSAPGSVTRVEIPGGAYDAVVAGGRLYATDARGLRVYSLVDARQPALLGSYESADVRTAAATGVLAVDGGRGYLVRYEALIALDLVDPAAPRELGRVAIPAGGQSVVLGGTLAFVALGDAGLAVVNVADPAAPGVVMVSTALGPTRDVALGDTSLYAANGGGLAVARYPATVYRLLLPWSD